MILLRTVKCHCNKLLLLAAALAVGLLIPVLAFAQTPPVPEAVLKLPRDLSPWGMFMAADIVVKAVMIGLAFASVLTWTIWFAKAIELLIARRRVRAAGNQQLDRLGEPNGPG